ncbi:MAG: hypothetical protein ACI9MC_002139 [Kiritimatiellia bacterium]|jgi:hypothetical protein
MKTELKRALLRELASVWHTQNQRSFQRSMRPPTLGLHEGSRLGWWRPSTRELSLQVDLATKAPWSQVVEVLRHEMAHQYVHEVLRETQETAHGPHFRRVCQERNIDARAAGLPVLDDNSDDRVARRIRGLLALSNSDNEHEAKAAMRRARALLHEHNVALDDQLPVYTFKQVGPVSNRFSPWEKVLGGLLLQHFCVTGIYAQAYRAHDEKWGRALEIMGTPTNVEVAAYVHDVLRTTAESLWRAYRSDNGLSGNTERRRYLFGVMMGFSDSLQHDAEHSSTELIPSSDPLLQSYVGARYPHVRSSRARSTKVSEATDHGRAHGRKIKLRKGVSAEGDGPRQIADKRR